MTKLDFKKTYKELYVPKEQPVVVDVPAIKFITIEGEGDPNGEEFALATGALYSVSYGVKMSYKSNDIPQDYYDYIVFPLEGVWDLKDKTKPLTDKCNFTYKIMIRQPEFLTSELFQRFLVEAKRKKTNPYFEKMQFGIISEGMCCQILHVGSYDDEPKSFEKMEEFCKRNGFERVSNQHREIYLSDPRKIASSKLKTVLRYQIAVK